MLSELELIIGFIIMLISLFIIGSHSDNIIKALKGLAITALIGLLLYYAIRYSIWPQVPPIIIPLMMLALVLGKINEDRNSQD